MSINIVEQSYRLGQAVLSRRADADRKLFGQFLTPPAVARFMAWQLPPIQSGSRVLDPAVGSGVLACALIEQAILADQPVDLWVDCYEIDHELCSVAREALDLAAHEAKLHGINVRLNVREGDYVLGDEPVQQSLFSALRELHGQTYSHIIVNPPYFKLSNNDPRVKFALAHNLGHANIYALFMSLAIRQLSDEGRASFIVPRSFCSGAYFANFRRQFIQDAVPTSVHLFESRQEAFKDDEVLQENLILVFERRRHGQPHPEQVTITASEDIMSLQTPHASRTVSVARFWHQQNGHLFFKLPVSEFDERIVESIESWPGSLERFGLEVSTGPVVPFRAQSLLAHDEAIQLKRAVPLLWMQNVSRHQVKWPLWDAGKPQSILAEGANGLLVPARNYVVLRRFSAKEEPHRIVAAPLLADRFEFGHLGLENHLNYIYSRVGVLSNAQVLGLSALLNSNLIDRYIRIVNGNTQVNAAELRALALPEWEVIERIGARLIQTATAPHEVADVADSIVYSTLLESGCVPEDLPNISASRIAMAKLQKIQQAQQIQQSLGMPPEQQNEQAALTLLALCQLSEDTPWRKAEPKLLRIHDILTEIAARYDRRYAENTRETVRRHVIHQFEQAGLVARNPDDPQRPTNSPNNRYALTDAALQVVRAFGTKIWQRAVADFVEHQGTLLSLYMKSREQNKVPLRLSSGESYDLSPGKHNVLEAAIINEFGPRFAPGAQVLYLGDTQQKALRLDQVVFESLSVVVSSHDKLPDIVLYEVERNRLFLIEAVTSHGPVSVKRLIELERMFQDCPVGRVYVSAFPDFSEYRRHSLSIAWETEIWIADIPDHLIHYDGDKYLVPRLSSPAQPSVAQ